MGSSVGFEPKLGRAGASNRFSPGTAQPPSTAVPGFLFSHFVNWARGHGCEASHLNECHVLLEKSMTIFFALKIPQV